MRKVFMQLRRRRFSGLPAAMVTAGVLAFFNPMQALAFGADNCEGAKKVALMMGNSAYKGDPRTFQNTDWERLKNAANDASAVGAQLQALGFCLAKVELNLSKLQMFEVFDRWKKLAASAQQVVVYYAGHGVQHETLNYLIPVDAPLTLSASALETYTVPLTKLFDAVSRGNGIKVVMVDACRTLPKGFRGDVEQGYAELSKRPPQTLVVFAAEANKPASDGPGQNNGYFAEGLLQGLKHNQPNLFNVIREAEMVVRKRSAQYQIPFVYGSNFEQESFWFASPKGGIVDPRLAQFERLEAENRALRQRENVREPVDKTRFSTTPTGISSQSTRNGQEFKMEINGAVIKSSVSRVDD